MGRRKIEIKAIKDDRNRSVTFLKRKGGLFKKAHELSVLCSVDVTVIIFGQNKKLYEYSSGNINEILSRYQYYGPPHEHKGAADFAGKGVNDDDDEDDDNIGSPGPEEISPPRHDEVHANYHQQPAFQQVRHHSTSSASPPMPNGVYQKRMSTPQPQIHSRPTSRNQQHVRRASSNLVPTEHQQQQQQQQQNQQSQISQTSAGNVDFHYEANNAYYQSLGPSPNSLQVPLHQNSGHLVPQHHYSNPVPIHGQVQYMQLQQDNRRQSMPPNFTVSSQERSTQGDMSQPPLRPQRPFHSPPLQEQTQATRHSIYTPIDDTRSILAQQWGSSTNSAMPSRNDPQTKIENGPRSQSIDVSSAMRRSNGTSPQPNFAPPPYAPLRATSVSGVPAFGPPMRHDSIQSDIKRPRLKVQIPSEHSDGGSTTGETGGSSPKKSGTSAGTGSTKAAAVEGPLSSASGVVLPPPSPSASALLSAGATGPKNPFARPPPPSSSLNNTTLSYRDTETPLSALPSRFMGDVLPSPSQFYPDWNFGSNNMNSPALYQPTPLAMHGPSFRDDDQHNKRKSDEDTDGAYNKKARASN